jgi:hypothetical protein
MSGHAAPMSIRTLFAMLIAVALLVAPAVTGVAMAGSPHHQMEMTEPSDCQTPPASSGDHQKMAGKNCCIAMCMAVAITPSVPAELSPQRRQIAEFASPKAFHGLLAEIATPPPRGS